MTTTEFLNLVLNDTSEEDLARTFLEYRQSMNGPSGSNMCIIDSFCKEISDAVAELQSALTRFAITINGISADASGNFELSAQDIGAATEDHDHSQYAGVDHLHTQYADKEHHHDEYALETHDHAEYSENGHTHSQYADVSHKHDEYAQNDHAHSQYVTSGSSPTFDVVTANKVIGAVYA